MSKSSAVPEGEPEKKSKPASPEEQFIDYKTKLQRAPAALHFVETEVLESLKQELESVQLGLHTLEVPWNKTLRLVSFANGEEYDIEESHLPGVELLRIELETATLQLVADAVEGDWHIIVYRDSDNVTKNDTQGMLSDLVRDHGIEQVRRAIRAFYKEHYEFDPEDKEDDTPTQRDPV